MDHGQLALLMTMVVPIATFVFVILILWVTHSSRHKREKLQAELCLKALETGQPLPERLFQTPPRKKIDPLKTSIILIAIAVGGSSWGLFTHNLNVVALALIPFFIGVGYLVIHFIARKRGEEVAK